MRPCVCASERVGALALVALLGAGCLPEIKGYTCASQGDCFAGEVCLNDQCSPVISPDQGGDMGAGDMSAQAITIRGEVKADGGGALGSGAVVCTDELGGDRALVGADGKFSLQIEPGDAQVVVVQGWSDGFEATSETIQLTAERVYQVTLTLPACAAPPCASPCP